MSAKNESGAKSTEPTAVGIAFGRYLRDLRKGKGLNQAELAQRVDITGGYYGFFEQGRQIPSLKIINRLADVLETDYLEMAQKAGYDEFEARKKEMPRNHSSNTSASGAGTDDNGTKQKEEDADTNANDDVYGVMVKRPTGTKQSAADTGTLDTDASESATLRWAYECIKRDPNFNYEERMGGQDLPPGVWLGFIEMYQGLTARVLLKPDEIQRFRNAPTEEAT